MFFVKFTYQRCQYDIFSVMESWFTDSSLRSSPPIYYGFIFLHTFFYDFMTYIF
jgi:hypothetical protein